MGADLYESYVGSIVSTLALATAANFGVNGVAVPLLLAAAGVATSIFGSFFVKTKEGASQKNLLSALRIGTYISSALIVAFSYVIVAWLLPNNMGVFTAILSGLLAGTHLPLRVFGITLLEGLLALVYGIPYVLAMVAAGLCAAMLSVLGILVAIPVYLWSLWGIMKIAARYSMAPFILWDRPEMPALDCLNLSRTMMEGHEGKYIWLELTFLGWILLGMVTWGIPMIWVNPYMQLTMAGFYRALGGDNIAFPHKPQPEEPETRDDLKDAFTTSASRDQEDK
jgi:uncharacterized membrane protein